MRMQRVYDVDDVAKVYEGKRIALFSRYSSFKNRKLSRDNSSNFIVLYCVIRVILLYLVQFGDKYYNNSG